MAMARMDFLFSFHGDAIWIFIYSKEDIQGGGQKKSSIEK